VSEVVISPVAKGLTLVRAAPAPPESALRAPLYLKISISLRAGSVREVRPELDAAALLVSNGRVPGINWRISETLFSETL
jgi:hypothetical protein